jgi:hypothetical protein
MTCKKGYQRENLDEIIKTGKVVADQARQTRLELAEQKKQNKKHEKIVVARGQGK